MLCASYFLRWWRGRIVAGSRRDEGVALGLIKDAAEGFVEANPGLVPANETIRAVIRAIPKGEAARRSAQVNVRVPKPAPTPIAYQGIAARWPTSFARNANDPNTWSVDTDWFFWIVITDRQLHAFEGRSKGWTLNRKAGPEAAHFPLDEIHDIWFDKGAISQLHIRFEDGSVVELEAGMQKFDRFVEAIGPLASSTPPPPDRRGWMPRLWLWALGVALLVGGMAVSVGSSTETGSAKTVMVAIGVTSLALGALVVIRIWRPAGWKRPVLGTLLVLLGLLFGGASLDDTCECGEMIYTGGALIVIGGAALVRPTDSSNIAASPDPEDVT